jgi:hypothetical protein
VEESLHQSSSEANGSSRLDETLKLAISSRLDETLKLAIDRHLDAIFSARLGLRFLTEHFLGAREPREGCAEGL